MSLQKGKKFKMMSWSILKRYQQGSFFRVLSVRVCVLRLENGGSRTLKFGMAVHGSYYNCEEAVEKPPPQSKTGISRHLKKKH